MAYYDALITKWGTLTPGTTAAKLAQVNAATATGTAIPMIVPTYKIYNLIVAADFNALTTANQQLVRDILGMGAVDCSPGTAIRARIVSLFPNGTATFTALSALAATYDSPQIPWWQATVAQGGGGLSGPVSQPDLDKAGNLT